MQENEVVMEQPQTTAPLAEAPVDAVRETPEPSSEIAPLASDAAPAAVQDAMPTSPPPLKLEWPADLVQVETDPQKIAAAAAQPQPEPAPRRPRVRKPLPPPSTEPLIQVETRSRETAEMRQV